MFEDYSSSIVKLKKEEEFLKTADESELKAHKKNKIKTDKNDASSIVKSMVDKNYEEYTTKRRFMKAQYHQCMPNPMHDEEMITVQLVTSTLT